MKSRITVLALCIGMLAGTTAQAQEIKVIPDSQSVVFSDKISPDTLGICFVVKKGESIDDNSKVYALKNARSDKDGNIEFSFVMPETKNNSASDGEYELYIKESGKAVKKAEFIYASVGSRTGLISALKGVPVGDTRYQELQTILEAAEYQTTLKALGCRTDYYSANTLNNLCSAIADFSAVTEDSFRKEYNLASVKDEFLTAEKDRAEELLSVISPEFEQVGYNSIDNQSLKDWIASLFVKTTYSHKKYEVANILYKFNSSVADGIDDLFAKYSTSLGIAQDERYVAYNKLTSKARVNIKIAEILYASPAKSVNSLLDAVKTAIASTTTAGSGGGGGAGGSGGSGGGGSQSPSVAPQNPIVSGIPTDTQAVVSEKSKFRDMNLAQWAKKAVISLAEAGIVSGDDDGNFRPNDYISREEFVTMLVLAANKYNKDAVCDFDDVPKSKWYYSYVASANQYGMVHGISERSFGAGYALTRQDMAVLCLRAKGEVPKIRDAVDFADNSEIADYAKDAVAKLYMSGAISGMGDNRYAPLGQATRAECAQIIFNLFLK